MKRCEYCGREFTAARSSARFCSAVHRVYWHRHGGIPEVLTSRDRWVRWELRLRRGGMAKVPLTVDGLPASSTDPSSWSSFADVKMSGSGNGFGFVLNGDGVCCVDLDHVLHEGVIDSRAERFLRDLDSFYTEVSPSGDGIHAWTFQRPLSGNRYTLPDGLKVEWYETGRYITVTGVRF